jgi:hypothetical protein
MIRVLVLTLAATALAGCFPQHSGAVVADTDCVSCHQPEFDTAVTHMGQGSTKCSACHSATVTPPWAFAHPTAPFSLASGRHAQFAKDCHTCHNETRGNDYRANLDCYGNGACHQDSHNRDPAQPARCFSCHPSGNVGD